MRWPRAVKKMPEGASTGSSRRTAKVAVSTTVTRLLLSTLLNFKKAAFFSLFKKGLLLAKMTRVEN